VGPKVGGCFLLHGFLSGFGVDGLMTVNFRSLWIGEVTECARFMLPP
jgi:hypothetical protein